MPAIRIRKDEAPVPREKAITFRDFLTIHRDVDKAIADMRKTCLEGADRRANFVCTTYKDQVEHYIRTLLRTRAPGVRGPIESLLRRMGPQEYATVRDVEALWKRAEEEYPELVEEGRAGPEFLEDEEIAKWEKKMEEMVGVERFEKIKEIKRMVTGGESPPVEAPVEPKPLKEGEEIGRLEEMRKDLEERIRRLRRPQNSLYLEE